MICTELLRGFHWVVLFSLFHSLGSSPHNWKQTLSKNRLFFGSASDQETALMEGSYASIVHQYKSMHFCIHASMHPYIHTSMHPCFHASILACFHASMLPCHVTMHPCITLPHVQMNTSGKTHLVLGNKTCPTESCRAYGSAADSGLRPVCGIVFLMYDDRNNCRFSSWPKTKKRFLPVRQRREERKQIDWMVNPLRACLHNVDEQVLTQFR